MISSRVCFSPLPRGHGSGCDPSNPSGLPRRFRGASPCPGVDRPASGLAPVTCRAFTRASLTRISGLRLSCFRFGFRLATEANSLARFSKRTAVSPSLSRELGRLTVATWFQDLFTGFHPSFSAFPHGTSALSVSGQYLGLEVDDPHLPAGNPTNRTQESEESAFSPSPTGLSPSMAPLSRGLRLGELGGALGPYSTSPLAYR